MLLFFFFSGNIIIYNKFIKLIKLICMIFFILLIVFLVKDGEKSREKREIKIKDKGE